VSDIVKTIVESMSSHPDRWQFLHIRYSKVLRLQQGEQIIDVDSSGDISVKDTHRHGTTTYGDVPIGFFEKRRVKAAFERLFREKALRIIERTTLDDRDTPA